jgi:hypothetical protein
MCHRWDVFRAEHAEWVWTYVLVPEPISPHALMQIEDVI